MSFLQPWMLFALPIMALPIIIHLINQRRYQTLPWGAMMFLLAANRMSRGYARIRQWLILLVRTLAIAALIFMISRPLASGWIGAAAGGSADTAIILLDRSPSMHQRGEGTSVSKLETGVAQLAAALETLAPSRTVLIDSATPEPRELAAMEHLRQAPDTAPVDAAADLPTMLLSALDYIRANKLGQTDIWICSDLREHDWHATDGRWQSIRDAFAPLGRRVRFHLLAYPQLAEDNASIRVTSVRRQQSPAGAYVAVSLQIVRGGAGASRRAGLPVEFEVDGARSIVEVEAGEGLIELVDHRLPIAENHLRGWGRVSIPADANSADNTSYFVFDVPPPRRALVVSDDPAASRAMELAAGIAPRESMEMESTRIAAGDLSSAEWKDLSLVLWQGPLPTGRDAELIEAFVDRGGRILFFPSQEVTDKTFFGVRWGEWNAPQSPVAVESWRGDSDLLGNTQSGAALPVGTLEVRRYIDIEGEVTPLATLSGGKPLLVRATTERGGVYFWTSTPDAADSSLATEGVVLYVAIQRAADAGAESLGSTGQAVAGMLPPQAASEWVRVVGREEGLSSELAFQAGVYQVSDRLLAVNRPVAEDAPDRVGDETVETLFGGLPLDRVDDTAGNLRSLVQEIWRAFLVAMMISMMIESALCLPNLAAAGGVAT